MIDGIWISCRSGARSPVGSSSFMAFVLKKYAKPGDPIRPGRVNSPVAPGAVSSPQVPGEVPDRSTIAGEGVLPVPLPVGPVQRPLTQYGTAEAIMGVYEPRGGNQMDKARFEMKPPSFEEVRKAIPSFRTPIRPTAGYALSEGTRLILDPALQAANENLAIEAGE
jgi:hypothetical protein